MVTHVFAFLTVDDTKGDRFTSFGLSLTQTSQRAARAFGIGGGSLKPWHIGVFVVTVFMALYVMFKIVEWWTSGPVPV